MRCAAVDVDNADTALPGTAFAWLLVVRKTCTSASAFRCDCLPRRLMGEGRKREEEGEDDSAIVSIAISVVVASWFTTLCRDLKSMLKEQLKESILFGVARADHQDKNTSGNARRARGAPASDDVAHRHRAAPHTHSHWVWMVAIQHPPFVDQRRFCLALQS